MGGIVLSGCGDAPTFRIGRLLARGERTQVKSKKFTIQNLLLTFPLNSRATISDLIAHLIDDGHLSLSEEHTLIVNEK